MSRVSIIETNLEFNGLLGRDTTQALVVHHTGGNVGDDLSAAEIHAMHQAQHWAGIGYHYVIRKNGDIERGRPRWARGAHSIPGNDNSIGIHLAGNFNGEEPTQAQLDGLAALCADLIDLYGDIEIVGHRDQYATACPGDSLYAALPSVRAAVAQLRG